MLAGCLLGCLMPLPADRLSLLLNRCSRTALLDGMIGYAAANWAGNSCGPGLHAAPGFSSTYSGMMKTGGCSAIVPMSAILPAVAYRPPCIRK
jgi:hypothetical protein